MKQRQNIATTLLLLVWAAMFCLSVLVTLSKQSEKSASSYSSALENNEELTSDKQSEPVAWTEQTQTHVVTSHTESLLHLYAGTFWLLKLRTYYSEKKPVKVLLAFASATSRFRILPNAP
ncbi:hypothetical protein [Pontibacter pudoricolor]|uniref:hypothetical protein n=1 Tax=Pontibacter pudoricolor TaxID=2694930 RepID=UPI001390EEA1|nr:hypothetical protein [Pontibacter pudoricolor]